MNYDEFKVKRLRVSLDNFEYKVFDECLYIFYLEFYFIL